VDIPGRETNRTEKLKAIKDLEYMGANALLKLPARSPKIFTHI
jgi:hypothetical protein